MPWGLTGLAVVLPGGDLCKKKRREKVKSEKSCVSVGGCNLPEQGDGRGGGEGEVDKPIAAFNCRGSAKYSKAKSVGFSFSRPPSYLSLSATLPEGLDQGLETRLSMFCFRCS